MAKHAHRYKEFVSWVNAPFRESDYHYCHTFTVNAKCSCGNVGKREATYSEVEEYLNNLYCKRCGEFMDSLQKHNSETDCFVALRSRVSALEKALERISNAFSNG